MKRPIENGIRPWQQMLSSGTGAIVTALFMTPMDVVKTRLQVQKKPLFSVCSMVSRHINSQCFVYCNGLMDHLCTCINGKTGIKPWYKLPGHFNGTFDALVKIARHEGLKSLWSGLPPTMLMAVPATVIYFTAYDQLKLLLGRMLNNQNPSKIWYIPMLAGTIARVGAVTVISPLELIRTKMQSRSLTYVELKDCVRAALVKEGWLSLWKGWSATVLRDVPFSALYWCNYEIFKSYLCRRYGVTEANFTISFTAGAASGTIAAVATLPFDVVKTHRQIEIGEIESLQHNKKPSSTLAIMKKIHMENGYRGLFAGITPRIIKVAPACAIMISSYEFGKRFFRRRNQGHLEKP